jgi:hypothetical protein
MPSTAHGRQVWYCAAYAGTAPDTTRDCFVQNGVESGFGAFLRGCEDATVAHVSQDSNWRRPRRHPRANEADASAGAGNGAQTKTAEACEPRRSCEIPAMTYFRACGHYHRPRELNGRVRNGNVCFLTRKVTGKALRSRLRERRGIRKAAKLVEISIDV